MIPFITFGLSLVFFAGVYNALVTGQRLAISMSRTLARSTAFVCAYILGGWVVGQIPFSLGMIPLLLVILLISFTIYY